MQSAAKGTGIARVQKAGNTVFGGGVLDDWLSCAEAGADEEEDWLLDTRPLWQDTIRAATRLAAHWEPFRQALKSDPKVKQWLADSEGATQGQTHMAELRPLLKALAES